MQSTTHEATKERHFMQIHSFTAIWKIQACEGTVWEGGAQDFHGPNKNRAGKEPSAAASSSCSSVQITATKALGYTPFCKRSCAVYHNSLSIKKATGVAGRKWKLKINSLLALNLFSLRVLPVFFRQLSQTNLLRKKKCQNLSINPSLTA